MSKHKKQRYQRSLNRTIGLAYLARYEPLLILICSFLPTMGDDSLKRLRCLLLGIGFVVMATHYFLGYLLGWKHIYCMYQDMAHQPMTPDHINWKSVNKRDHIPVPIIFLVLGIALILYADY